MEFIKAINVTHVERDFTCGKLFSDAGDLKKHIHTIHENQKDQNDFKCESCM